MKRSYPLVERYSAHVLTPAVKHPPIHRSQHGLVRDTPTASPAEAMSKPTSAAMISAWEGYGTFVP